jgi:uncharacterized protein (TIGR02246 family)
MTTTTRTRKQGAHKLVPKRTSRPTDATSAIREIGNAWAHNWNAGDLEKVVAAYAPDAVYLPPHHEAVHDRDAIREYLRGPCSRGLSGMVFDVTYVKQSGNVAWDVGTYRMNVPQDDGSTREDHGKYLTVWKRTGTTWLITADAWSSDLPAVK